MCRIPARQHRRHDQDHLARPVHESRRAKNEFYRDEEELVMDYAAAVNAEMCDLKAAGADVIQLDEPWLQARAEEARRLALAPSTSARFIRHTGRARPEDTIEKARRLLGSD
jgi:methionine synthase II (cobalamin-independent)